MSEHKEGNLFLFVETSLCVHVFTLNGMAQEKPDKNFANMFCEILKMQTIGGRRCVFIKVELEDRFMSVHISLG